jgi:hypothetical protein
VARADIFGFGAPVAFIGDLDGDGRDEILAGAPLAAPLAKDNRPKDNPTDATTVPAPPDPTGNPLMHAPRGAVLACSSRDGAVLRERRAEQDCIRLVGPAGDLDGDGVADYALGRSALDASGTEHGALQVVSGKDDRELFQLAAPEDSQAVFAAVPLRHAGTDGRPGLAITMLTTSQDGRPSRLIVAQAERR